MATVFAKYDAAKKYFGDGTLVIDTNLRLALVTSSYTPSAASHTVWADVSAYEVSNGDGYTTGGAALTNILVNKTKWDADDTAFNGLTKTFRYGVLYRLGTYNSVVNPLFAYILYDDTPADLVFTGLNFVTRWSANGILVPS